MTFTLEVEFTGLCLYVVNDDMRQVAVLMPDARLKKRDDPNAPDPMIHLDNTRGKPHVGYIRYDLADAGVKVPSDKNLPEPLYEGIHRFTGEELDFSLGFDEPLEPIDFGETDGVTTSLHVPDINSFAPSLALQERMFSAVPPDALLMRAILRGGKLDSVRQRGIWRIDPEFGRAPAPVEGRFAGVATWTRRVHTDELVLRVAKMNGETNAEIRLRPSGPARIVRLKVGNLCADNPLEWSDLDIREFTGQFDEDFKWFYRLLEVPEDHIRVMREREAALPSPEFLRFAEDVEPEVGGGTGESDCTGSRITARF